MTEPGTAEWRRAEASRLITFGWAAALADGGFGWLGANGEIDVTQPCPLYVNARMTHVFALAHLEGAVGADSLATSSAVAAGIPGADSALAAAAATIERHFWSDAEGCALESWNADFTEPEPYRGANSNMHSLEAYLAAGDVTGNPVWHARAMSIATRLINGHARAHSWRVPEHYDERWQPRPDYNLDRP